MSKIAAQEDLALAKPPSGLGVSALKGFLRRFHEVPTPFEVVLPSGEAIRLGHGEPQFRLLVKSRRGLAALSSMDEGNFGEVYLAGELDLEGDMLSPFALRQQLGDAHPFTYVWRFIHPFLFGQTKTNKRAIESHYDIDPAFFLSFLDPDTPCYTQGMYASANESLSTATIRKFDWCLSACRFQPGDRILEIGPGWGAFLEYGWRRGLKMTGVTNSVVSRDYLNDKAQKIGADWEIVLSDFLDYAPDFSFDGIVIMGVIEHLPQYDAVLAKFERLLKPGGHVFLDGSAATKKYELSSFMVRHIYGGNHSFLVLDDLLRAMNRTSLRVEELHNDRESYFYTFRQWATNFERNKQAVISKFGEFNFRRFQLYLWGAAYEFLSGSLDCYRMALRLPDYRRQGGFR